ncbi:MAG: hypothetical protein ACP5E4_00535 [Candidatus Aenigmatarchaeota archaeon]
MVKIGTRELARNFNKDLVGVILEPDRKPNHWIYLNCVKPGDLPFNFYIVGEAEFSDYSVENTYMGKVLVREGRVHYYDRYPVGGGPFEVRDFQDIGFRKRSELIVKNINQLLGYDEEPGFTKETTQDLRKGPYTKLRQLP